MNKTAIQAIRSQLGYLEDNRYRYVRLGGYSETHPTVLDHDRQILELKQALLALGERP